MDAVRLPLTNGLSALVDAEDAAWLAVNWRWTWHLTNRGYVASKERVGGRQKSVLLHRLLLGFPKLFIDHRDLNKLNNTRQNLRICTTSQNQANRPAMPHCSRFKGVTIDQRTGKFCAQIHFNNKRKWLGTFATEEAAARAYDVSAIELFGEFARPNFASYA